MSRETTRHTHDRSQPTPHRTRSRPHDHRNCGFVTAEEKRGAAHNARAPVVAWSWPADGCVGSVSAMDGADAAYRDVLA
ncbi:MAG: hypothetical protein ABI640_08615, partial [Gammaproteobacteria bacterium]